MAHHYYTSVSHRDLAAHQATQKEVSCAPLPPLPSALDFDRPSVSLSMPRLLIPAFVDSS